jgi:uncharacterized protein (TIGR00255 family)
MSSASPIYSMTGYASEQSTTEDGVAFTLTLKSVNHRFLDLGLRMPADCEGLEAALRRLLKDRVKRGHVDVILHIDRRARDAGAATLQLNRELLAAHIRVFHEAAHQHHLIAAPNLNELLRMPGVLSSDASVPTPDPARGVALEPAVLHLAASLLDHFNAVRAGEGTALATELLASMLRLRSLTEESAALRIGAREAHFERLRTRIGELLGGDIAAVDQRLLAEAALIAERADIEEELVRLRAHIASFLDLLAAGGELGKRLDFLLQELNREANTLLSKTTAGDAAAGLRLTSLGLAMKAEIEKVREQVQNIE